MDRWPDFTLEGCEGSPHPTIATIVKAIQLGRQTFILSCLRFVIAISLTGVISKYMYAENYSDSGKEALQSSNLKVCFSNLIMVFSVLHHSANLSLAGEATLPCLHHNHHPT